MPLASLLAMATVAMATTGGGSGGSGGSGGWGGVRAGRAGAEYTGSLLGVRARATLLTDGAAHIVLDGAALGGHVEGTAYTNDEGKVVLDAGLERKLRSRLCALQDVTYHQRSDSLTIKLELPFFDATLGMARAEPRALRVADGPWYD
jgi:hypothetical protein